jgi:hypothetical protein
MAKIFLFCGIALCFSLLFVRHLHFSSVLAAFFIVFLSVLALYGSLSFKKYANRKYMEAISERYSSARWGSDTSA